nr:hypothetical protein [Tanacetum cinerariifolium]
MAETASANRFVCLYSKKLASNDFSLSSKQNTEAKVAMVDGVIIGVDVGRGATEDEAIAKIDSIPTSLVGFSMLVTNCDDTGELS